MGPSPTDALWYWDRFVSAKKRYLLIQSNQTKDLEDKNMLLEIMVGNLLGFIEEICADPDPVLPAGFQNLPPESTRQALKLLGKVS